MKRWNILSTVVLLTTVLAAIGCGSADSKIPTTVSADEQKQVETAQQTAADAERQHRQTNPHQ